MAKPRILIMAGGTGGHVFPGLAVADELYQRGWQVDWLGTAERMEAQLVPKHGYPIHFIQVKGVRGNGLLRKLASPLVLAKAVFQALKLLREVRPQVVLGMGGFASGPGGIAAKLLGIPVVLHEQNAAAGLTNRYLSKVAKHSLMAFPGALEGGQVVGNPVRSEVLALPAKHYQSANSFRVLVIGGSLGAQVLNQQLAAVVSAFKGPIEVLHQVGAGKLDDTLSAYAAVNLKPSKDLRIQEFIDDMAAAYHWADVIICRAGALTVSEVAAAGLPAIFVPLPHAVDDHQTKNANFLVDQAAAQLIAQPQLNTESLLAALEHYQNLSVRQLAADRARELAISNATTRVADICSHFGSTHE